MVPVANESGLRNLAWIEDNRRKVDQMTGGKVAYIYMPDTANGGLTAFNRYFYAQIGKDAADHGRALQRRRTAGHRHRGDPEPEADERRVEPRGRAAGSAAGHFRTQR